jgi:hyperosmotically inducible periplasmic protein
MRIPVVTTVVCALLLSLGCAESDPGLTTSIKTQLAADDQVKARKIDVDTKDRVVTLKGEVQSSAEETRALEIARKTSGVASVVDEISVVPDAGATPTTGRTPDPLVEVTMTDPGITAEIKKRLLDDPQVGGLKIDVDTTDRVVTLKGAVSTQAEKDRALAIAREVKQAVRVEDRLTIRKQ